MAEIFFAMSLCKVPVFVVFLVRIQSKCEKILTRKTPNRDNFHALFAYHLFSSLIAQYLDT